MFTELAYLSGLASLSVASFYDVYSEKGDVPGSVLYFGAALSLVFALTASMVNGMPGLFGSSVMFGIAGTVYGVTTFLKGWWGGADAAAMAVLGFSAAPLLGWTGLFSLFVGFMVLGFLYAVIYGLYAARSSDVRSDFRERLRENRLTAASSVLIGAALISTGFTYLGIASALIVLLIYMRSVENVYMTETVKASDVEEGDVLADGKIVGVEDTSELEGEVQIKHGIRFMPVFPLAMLFAYTVPAKTILLAVL